MAGLLIPPQLQFLDENGAPLAGGQLYTYTPGTSNQKPTWQDAAETIFNTNPIILDDRGACICFGDGDFRLILDDQNGVQIFDALSSEPLPASAISAAMLPVVGALTLQQARDLMGITDAISSAVHNINLMTGPVGPTGSQGGLGPTGPTGPSGASAQNTQLQATNPGFWKDNTTGFMIQFGFGSTDATGSTNVTFAQPFAHTVFIVLADSVLAWADVSGINNQGFNCKTASPLFGGTWVGGPLGFWWLAAGY